MGNLVKSEFFGKFQLLKSWELCYKMLSQVMGRKVAMPGIAQISGMNTGIWGIVSWQMVALQLNYPLPTNTAPFNGPASNMVLCEDPFSGGQAFLLFHKCCEDPRDATHTVIDSSKPSEKVATCLLSKRLSSLKASSQGNSTIGWLRPWHPSLTFQLQFSMRTQEEFGNF